MPNACATERADCPWRVIVNALLFKLSSYLRRVFLAGWNEELDGLFHGRVAYFLGNTRAHQTVAEM
jgi:hypothetical protein